MGETYKKLAQGYMATTTGVLYTVPASTQVIIKHIRVINVDTANRWIELYDGGTAETNLIIPRTYVASGGMVEIAGPVCIAAAGTLQGKAETASKLVITVYGVELT